MRRLAQAMLAGCAVLAVLPIGTAADAGRDRHDMMRPRVPQERLEEARALTNPLAETPAIVAQGKLLYEGKGGCVACHGTSGRGDGPAGATLSPSPRNFHHRGFWRHRTEGELFWVVKHGSPGTGMVGFGHQLSDEEIWTILRYERTFAQRHGSHHQGHMSVPQP